MTVSPHATHTTHTTHIGQATHRCPGWCTGEHQLPAEDSTVHESTATAVPDGLGGFIDVKLTAVIDHGILVAAVTIGDKVDIDVHGPSRMLAEAIKALTDICSAAEVAEREGWPTAG